MRDFYRSAGMAVSAAGATHARAWIEHRSRATSTAEEEHFAHGLDELAGARRPGVLLDSRGSISRSACTRRALRRGARAVRDASARRARRTISSTSCCRRSRRLLVLARRRRHDEAEALSRAAVDAVETTDFFFARADVRVVHRRGRWRRPVGADEAAASRGGSCARDPRGEGRRHAGARLAARAPRRARHRGRLIAVARRC